MDYLVAPNVLYFKINDLLYIFNLQGQRELLSVQKCFSFIQFSQVKTGLTGSPTDSPNTFLFLHTPQTRHSLYAWLTHPIISNSPRQFPNNVSFIPFLYVCNLQSAIYVLVSLTVNSFSSYLPVCTFLIVRKNCVLCVQFAWLALCLSGSLSLPVVFDSHACLLSTKQWFSCLSLFVWFAVQQPVQLGDCAADRVWCTEVTSNNTLPCPALACAALLCIYVNAHDLC